MDYYRHVSFGTYMKTTDLIQYSKMPTSCTSADCSGNNNSEEKMIWECGENDSWI